MPLGSLYAVLLIQSTGMIKRRGERSQPCLTPVVTEDGYVNVPPCITWQVKCSYNSLIMLIFTGIP